MISEDDKKESRRIMASISTDKLEEMVIIGKANIIQYKHTIEHLSHVLEAAEYGITLLEETIKRRKDDALLLMGD